MVKNFKDISFSSFEALVDILSDCTDSFLFLLDVENNSVFISEQAGAIFDLPGKKFHHATDILLRLVAKEDQSLFSNELDDVISGKKDNFNLNYRALTKSHNSTWINLRGKIVCFGEEKKSILVGRIEIIDDIMQLDDVSKLPTEVQLRKDFDKVYKQKEKLSGFIMKIDVDKMGEINERHGTRVGDFILSMISDSVKRSIKNFGVAYKINSDEFICMNLKGATAVDASLFYQNLKRSLAEAEQRIDYEEVFTVSAGAVAFFKDSVQLDDLLKKANFTVSVAKEKGGNNLSMFNATDYSKHQRDLKLQEKLRLAIKNNYEEYENKDVCVAGRLLSKRGKGKVSFMDLYDRSGKIQIFAKFDDLGEEEYGFLKKWDIGDIVEVKGFVFKTQMGEISILHGSEVCNIILRYTLGRF